MTCTLTLDEARQVLEMRGGGVLRSGGHTAPPNDSAKSCKMCVRELRALACGLDWNDHPDSAETSPTDRACQILNDADWSSDAARTQACLPLALLSEATAPAEWTKTYAEQTIRQVIPAILHLVASMHPNPDHKSALEAAAERCAQEGTEESARAAADAADAAARAAADAAARAAAYAAADAARAAAYASAYAAADAAAYAAVYAADAEKDKILRLGVRLLLLSHGRDDLAQEVPTC